MTTCDLVVTGERIFTPEGVTKGQICVTAGKIATIAPLSARVYASRRIDASKSLVLPGLLDPHVHFRDPGMTHKEDFESGSRGAAAGGVTTVLDMPTTLPVVTNADSFEDKLEIVKSKSVVDFGLIAAASEANISDIQALARGRAIAFKTYTVSPPKERTAEYQGSFVTSAGQLLRVMREVARTGLVHCIHAEEDSTVQCLTDELRERGRRDPQAHCDSRPNLAEAEAVSSSILICEVTTGARLHIVHASTSEAVRLVKDAKSRGVDVTAETCPHYLHFTKDVLNNLGPYAKYNPPARNREDRENMARGLADRTIDFTASDHAPHTKDEKENGREDIFKAPPGTPGVETQLPLLLTLVDQGLLDLELIPILTSEAAAKRFGLYPSKGVIAPGADADLVLVDFSEWRIKASDLQTKSWESVIYDGKRVKGRVQLTILRGETAYERGVGFSKPGSGRFLGRKPRNP